MILPPMILRLVFLHSSGVLATQNDSSWNHAALRSDQGREPAIERARSGRETRPTARLRPGCQFVRPRIITRTPLGPVSAVGEGERMTSYSNDPVAAFEEARTRIH